MDETAAIFVLTMTGMSMIFWLLNSWIRGRHPANAKVGADTVDAPGQSELLRFENRELKGQIGRLEERLAVLERIATDPAERTAREIEQLRQD